MSNNNGGLVFSVSDTYHPIGRVEYGATGMTLRDYFAAMAMQGMFAADTAKSTISIGNKTRLAYEMADAMLVAREVGNE